MIYPYSVHLSAVASPGWYTTFLRQGKIPDDETHESKTPQWQFPPPSLSIALFREHRTAPDLQPRPGLAHSLARDQRARSAVGYCNHGFRLFSPSTRLPMHRSTLGTREAAQAPRKMP
ncbi:hypothetical protein CSPX01_11633 [Colletotrichum filicis]|nr:hypothetical protein CSPX01_11633 [Colletotrichum filicis]